MVISGRFEVVFVCSSWSVIWVGARGPELVSARLPVLPIHLLEYLLFILLFLC